MDEDIDSVAQTIGTFVENKINDIKEERARLAENEKKKKDFEDQAKNADSIYIEETQEALRKISEKLCEEGSLTWEGQGIDEIDRYFHMRKMANGKVFISILHPDIFCTDILDMIDIEKIDKIIVAKMIRDRILWIKGKAPTSIYIP